MRKEAEKVTFVRDGQVLIRVHDSLIIFIFRLMTEFFSSESKIKREDLRDMAINSIEGILSLKDGHGVSREQGSPLFEKIGLEKMLEMIRKM